MAHKSARWGITRERQPSWTETHWGLMPRDTRHMTIAEPRDNRELVTLGFVHQVVYVTKKGADPELVEYEHTFSRSRPPLLCYGSDDGRLFFAGGGYRITPHGIIG